MPQYVAVEWFIDADDAQRMREYAERHSLETPAQIVKHLLEAALGTEVTYPPVVTVDGLP